MGSENLQFDFFVSAHKQVATKALAKELLQSLSAYGFDTEELLYAFADLLKERGLEEAAIRLEQASELLPAGMKWDSEEIAK